MIAHNRNNDKAAGLESDLAKFDGDILLRMELRRKRLLAGLTQPQAAKIAGRSYRTYQYWECTGPSRTKVDMFRAAVLMSYLDRKRGNEK